MKCLANSTARSSPDLAPLEGPEAPGSTYLALESVTLVNWPLIDYPRYCLTCLTRVDNLQGGFAWGIGGYCNFKLPAITVQYSMVHLVRSSKQITLQKLC